MIRSPRSRVTIVPGYVWTPIGYLKVECMYDTVTQVQSSYSARGYLKVECMYDTKGVSSRRLAAYGGSIRP